MLDSDFVPKLILVAFFLLVGFPVHEFAHALAADRLGDGTARLFGRLTLDPRAHFDPVGGLMIVLTAFISNGLLLGWAKPTPVNSSNLRDRRNGEVWVALAGPFSNLVMAFAGSLVIRALWGQGVGTQRVYELLDMFVYFNVGLGVFNLIPLPPLDGSALLFRILPYETAWRVRPFLTQYGMLLLVAVIFVGAPLLGTIVYAILDVLYVGL